MNRIIAIFVLFCTLSVMAQNPRIENVGDFTEVKVFDRMRVNLIKSSENKVEISGSDIDDIELINKNGMLKVRMNIDKIFDGNRTFVKVFYNDLRTIDGNEGAQIVANELIEQQKLEIRVQEGAQITAGLNVENAEMRAVTGGIITVSGTAQKQHIELNTGGIFEGKELQTKNTEIRVQAGGEADIYASELAQIKIRAGGDIKVYGNPKQVEKDKFIGGSIKVMR